MRSRVKDANGDVNVVWMVVVDVVWVLRAIMVQMRDVDVESDGNAEVGVNNRDRGLRMEMRWGSRLPASC